MYDKLSVKDFQALHYYSEIKITLESKMEI